MFKNTLFLCLLGTVIGSGCVSTGHYNYQPFPRSAILPTPVAPSPVTRTNFYESPGLSDNGAERPSMGRIAEKAFFNEDAYRYHGKALDQSEIERITTRQRDVWQDESKPKEYGLPGTLTR